MKKKKIVTDYETSKEEEPEVVPTRKEKKNVETKELGPPPKPPQPKPSTCKGEVKSTSSVIPTPKPNSILNRRIHSKKSSAGDESIALKGSAEPSQLKQPISESAEQSSNHQLSPEISELNGDSGTFMMSDGPSDLESPRKSTSMVKQNLFKPVKLIRYKQGKKLSTRVHYDINALQRKQLCIPYAPFLVSAFLLKSLFRGAKKKCIFSVPAKCRKPSIVSARFVDKFSLKNHSPHISCTSQTLKFETFDEKKIEKVEGLRLWSWEVWELKFVCIPVPPKKIINQTIQLVVND